MSFYTSWFRLWLGVARSCRQGLERAAYFADPLEIRERFLSELSRITAEHMRSPGFLESMSRGLALMTASARLTNWLPFSPQHAAGTVR